MRKCECFEETKLKQGVGSDLGWELVKEVLSADMTSELRARTL